MPVPILKTAITHGRLCCSVLLLALITTPGLSQTIGYWQFTNSTSGTGSTNNTVSAADFSTAIPTKQYNAGTEYFGEGGWPSGALDPSAYFQFTISPNTGYQLDLSGVVLRIRRSTTGSPSGSGPTSWALRSSIDGYASNLSTNNLTTSYVNFNVPLGSSFLNRYTPVTFRLYGYNASVSSGGLSRLVVDSVSIQGIGSLLPVSLTGIQALRGNDKNISIHWQVTNIHEGSVFNVERSLNGTDFTTINSFAQTETRSTGSYQYEDDQPGNAPAIYYRIKINEPTGWTYFSWLVKVDNNAVKQLSINYTSIAGQSLVTSLQVPERGRYTVSLMGIDGSLLQQQPVDLDAGVQVFTLPLQSLTHGSYVVRLVGKEGLCSKKFVW
jgi:hypothetical protein